MFSARHPLACAILAGVTALAGLSDSARAQTSINEVVMYGIDSDTNELLYYAFQTDTYLSIGPVIDLDNNTVVDCESLAYIPDGPYAGFYTSSNSGANARKLVKINGYNARARVYPAENGFGHIRGLVAYEDATGNWALYATTTYNAGTILKLISIDPATGGGTELMTLGRTYEGLTQAPGGTLYGLTNDDLWIIDPAASTETLVGAHGWPRTEALEIAVGDGDPALNVPGVPLAWTANGAMFSFSDDSNALLVVNPATGEAVEYPCAFQTVDCEGLAFFSLASDPYGKIPVNPFD